MWSPVRGDRAYRGHVDALRTPDLKAAPDHAFAFSKYATRYLAAFAYRLNRRFALATLPARLLVAALHCRPLPKQTLRLADSRC